MKPLKIAAFVAALVWPVCARATVAPLTAVPTASYDSGILHIEQFGNPKGRPVVLVPALFCGPWQWGAQISALAPTYDLYVVTLPGFDGRPMVQGGDLMATAVADLHSFITAQKLQNVVVVGHSLGGTLTVLFAATYPNDAASVVSVEGGYPVAATQAGRDRRVAQSTKPYTGIPQSALGEALRATTLQYTITSPADVATVEPLAAKSEPAAIVAWLRAALSLDLTPQLANITIPLTVIVPFDATIDPYQGFKTIDDKRAAYIAWASHAKNPTVVVIDGSRHFVMFDRPQAFEEALEDALAAH